MMGCALMGGVLMGGVLMKLGVDGWWLMGGDGYLIRVEGLLGGVYMVARDVGGFSHSLVLFHPVVLYHLPRRYHYAIIQYFPTFRTIQRRHGCRAPHLRGQYLSPFD